jgi:Domain of unknown function (DUF4833)
VSALRALLFATALLWLSVVHGEEPPRGNSTEPPAIPEATTRVDLFVIERNKNRNQVQYALRVDGDCVPIGEEPVEVFWRMLEIGPTRTEPVGVFEEMAYGIKKQGRRSDAIDLRLKALETKRLVVRVSKGPRGCVAGAYAMVRGDEARIHRVYVHADEGALLPSVRYVEVTATTPAGALLSERLAPE